MNVLGLDFKKTLCPDGDPDFSGDWIFSYPITPTLGLGMLELGPSDWCGGFTQTVGEEVIFSSYVFGKATPEDTLTELFSTYPKEVREKQECIRLHQEDLKPMLLNLAALKDFLSLRGGS